MVGMVLGMYCSQSRDWYGSWYVVSNVVGMVLGAQIR